jgi:hypothetical protein
MQYFIKDLEKKLVLVDEQTAKNYGYFLAGFKAGAKSGGKLCLIENTKGKTRLNPLYTAKGKLIVQPENAGKYLKEINF